MKLTKLNITNFIVKLGLSVRRIVLPAFFYVWGSYLAFRSVLFDKIIGWRSVERHVSEWLNQYWFDGVNDFGRESGYVLATGSSELLIPVSLIVAVVFLLLAYKLTPK